MSDFILRYVGHDVAPGSLRPGECTIRRAATANGAGTYYRLWFRVPRDTDGGPETYSVPVVVRGPHAEYGLGGRSWGFRPSGPDTGTWQVSPSINVLDVRGRTVAYGPRPHRSYGSLWHHTPSVTCVPAGEPWQ